MFSVADFGVIIVPHCEGCRTICSSATLHRNNDCLAVSSEGSAPTSYWPCRYLRSRVAGPGQDRIDYRFLVGTAERDRRPCPEGTGFARGRGISELDRRSRKSVALDAEPRVRILLPPAESLLRTSLIARRSPRTGRIEQRPWRETSRFTGTASCSGLGNRGTELASPFGPQASAHRLC
jgi:hypothetical protein